MNTCNECGLETIFSGLCSDCQLWAGRFIPDIVADFQAIVHADDEVANDA